MRTKKAVNLDLEVESVAWLHIANPAVTMEEAIEKLGVLGNAIIDVDPGRRRIKCMHTKEYVVEERFVCERCGAHSKHRHVTANHESVCKGVG